MSRNVSARVGSDLFDRIERLASADDRSISQVLVKAIRFGLPELEREILGEPFVGRRLDGSQAEDEEVPA